METTVVYRGYIGIMEKNKTTTWFNRGGKRHPSLRVQVPNNHIRTQNMYYNDYYPKPKYLIMEYLIPKLYISLYIPIYPYISPLKGPNYWVLGSSGYRGGG